MLAVSAVAPDNSDLRGYVAPNKDTDVAAPTFEGLSYNITGQKCLVSEVATSWAAAEVSGVVALLRAAFPRDNAAAGRSPGSRPRPRAPDEVANPWTGAGVVQAHDALTRTLTLGRNGKVDRTLQVVGEDAMAPPAPGADRPVRLLARAAAVGGPAGGGADGAGVHPAAARPTLLRPER